MASTSQPARATDVMSGKENPRIFRAFMCPITHEIMRDPVLLAASNQTVNRAAAVKWFALGKSRCPVSGVSLSKSMMISNRALQMAMRECDLGISAMFPRAFICPVTNIIMRDPVLIVGSEQTISRTAYNMWRASKSRGQCPVTKRQLANTDGCENIALRKALEEWEEKYGNAPYEVYGADGRPSATQTQMREAQQQAIRSLQKLKNLNMGRINSCVRPCLLITYLCFVAAAVAILATSSMTETKVHSNSLNGRLTGQLLRSADSGELPKVEELVALGVSVDAQDEQGNSPVFLATASEHLDIVELLLHSGANTEILTKDGETPLLRAVLLNNLLLASILIEGGAQVSGVNPSGVTPLLLATNQGLIEMSMLLLARGADTEESDSKGWTPLAWAAYRNNIDIVRMLISAGSRPDVRVSAGQNGVPSLSTPLHIAASQGFIEVAEVLITVSGVELRESRDSNGRTPLEVMCESCPSSANLLSLLS